MKCRNPDCGFVESKVKKTIIHIEQMGGPEGFQFGELKMRVRECLECGELFETFEVQRVAFERIAKAKTISEAWSKRVTPPPTRRPLKTPLPDAKIDLRRSLDD